MHQQTQNTSARRNPLPVTTNDNENEKILRHLCPQQELIKIELN